MTVPDITVLRDRGLGNASYVVELGDGSHLVVDPRRDPRPYLGAGRPRIVIETHLHADFVTGADELAALGAERYGPGHAQIARTHCKLFDGDEVELNGLTLRALATPGHTPEHLAYLLLDGAQPVALFSGGALISGSAARTDLVEPELADLYARDLYRALHERIPPLPDELPVYPTHGAGSFCAAGTGEHVTTLGRERATNPLLQAADEDEFVTTLLGSFGSYPAYFHRLRDVNMAGPRVYGLDRPTLLTLSPDDVRAKVAAGAELIDVRLIDAYANGHIPGSLSIALRPAFPSWLGWLVEPDRDLVFVLADDQSEDKLVEHCLGIGYERLAGRLAGGIDAWIAAGGDVVRTDVTNAEDLAGQLLDVRQDNEYVSGHIPGVTHIELGSLPEIAAPNGPLTVMCNHGERAATGASVLERAGRTDIAFAVGGSDEWSKATGRPLETGPGGP